VRNYIRLIHLNTLTARTLRCALGALSLLTFCMFFTRPANSQSRVAIRVVTESDTDFIPLLLSYYPGLSSLPDFNSRAHTLAILLNQGDQPVPAYSVQWNEQSSEGDSHPIATSMFIERHSLPSDLSKKMDVGSVRLISPLFNLSPNEYASNKDFAEFYKVTLLPRVIPNMQLSITVDGVFLKDGSVAGSHADKLSAHYKCARNADHDEAIAVLAAMDQTSSSSLIVANRVAAILRADNDRALLYTQTQVPHTVSYENDPSSKDLDARSLYVYSRRESAANYLAILQNEGSTKLKQRLEKVAALFPNMQYSNMAEWF
jgi:hypothetical protein